MSSPVARLVEPLAVLVIPKSSLQILNTLSDHSQCTVVFQVITALMSFVFSIPRTLKHVSLMGIVSAICMGIAMLLTLVYSGIQDHPVYGQLNSPSSNYKLKTCVQVTMACIRRLVRRLSPPPDRWLPNLSPPSMRLW